MMKPRPSLNLYMLHDRKRYSGENDFLMNLSDEYSDEENFAYQRDNISDITTSESDFVPTMPVSRYADQRWSSRDQRRRQDNRTDRRILSSVNKETQPRMPRIHHSSTLNIRNIDDLSSKDDCQTPNRILRGLSMIEEISPISSSEDRETVPSLQLTRSWRPIHTSTTTSMCPPALPKTNPRHAKGIPTPVKILPGRSLLHPSNPEIFTRTENIYDQTPYDDTSYPVLVTNLVDVNSKWKPDDFGIPAPYARRIGCKGKVYLTMSLSGPFLTITVNTAVYFLDPSQCQASSYARVEIKNHPSYRRHVRSVSEDRYCKNLLEQSYRTKLIPLNNKPQFYESFTLELHRKNFRYRDSLSVSVWVTNADNTSRKRMLGCMAFPLRRLIKKANIMVEGGFSNNLHSLDRTVINDGAFFLLKPELGEKQNFPETKINVTKYYDDIGIEYSSSTISHSPSKVMRHSNWSTDRPTSSMPSKNDGNTHFRPVFTGGFPSTNKAAPNHYVIESSSSDDLTGVYLANPHSTDNKLPLTIRHNDMNYTTGSSSLTSYPLRSGICPGMPSIITTSDGTSEISNMCSHREFPLNSKLLHSPSDNRNSQAFNQTNVLTGMKRAASFTFSPTKSSADEKRIENETESKWKLNLQRISKTWDYLRSKVEHASTSTLYPTKEQVRSWQDSFESLLNHKYGCLLFRTFLKGEFSDENIDFWIECEEFKKLKEGKKSTIQKAHAIFSEYVVEQAAKEVNLDSDTRAATKAALESGAKPNTFSLAQTRIEQLMAKDSYRRFLKSRMFLDLLNGGSTPSGDGTNKVFKSS